MSMRRTEFKNFIERQLRQQGSASGASLGALADELLNHIPNVVTIGDKSEGESGKTVYKVTNEQAEIDEIIASLRGNEMANVCVHDKGVTLHFNHIEVADDMVQCYLTTFDGTYNLTLSSEAGFSELCHVPNGTAVFSSDFSSDFAKSDEDAEE